MDLASLKAQLEAVQAQLEADPENQELKAKVEQAQAAYDEAAKSQEGQEPDESQLDEKTKAYIAKLRKENASHRTKAKELGSKLKVSEEQKRAVLKAIGIESEDEKPEEKVKSLSAQSQALAFRNAILESAVQAGISGDDVEYYEFLISKRVSALEEGEELGEDELAEIVTRVQKKRGATSTSVGTGKGAQAPQPGASGAISLDQFCRMTIMEKVKLHDKNPELYKQLTAEAKSKRKLV